VAANVAHQAGTLSTWCQGIQMIRDDPRRMTDPVEATDRRRADSAGHARAPHDAGPRAPTVEAQIMDLADIIVRVRDMALPRLARHHIRLTHRSPRLPAPVDATQLEMALFNLVTNAIDAMPGGVRCRLPPRHIRTAAAGSGQSGSAVSTAFDPVGTTKPVGHGSGLRPVRDVVQAHRG
jgi:signal transduction histidine kinase